MLNKIRNNYGGIKAFLRHMKFNATGYFTQKRLKTIIFNSKSRIVFVCKGNICRSAFAHWYMKGKVKNTVISFGLITDTGKPANNRILKQSEQVGIDLTSHLTTAVEDYQHKETDILVCMEPWQFKALRDRFPGATITILSAYLNKPRLYLHDPYASSEAYVKTSLDLIKESVDNWIELSKTS